MRESAAKRLLKDTFSGEYEEEKFIDFVKEVFKRIDIDVQDKSQYIAKQYWDYISEFRKIGEYKDSKGENIEILSVKLKRTSSRDRARTMQRNFVASWLSKTEKDAGLVAFYGDEPDDWRLSFVKVEYALDYDKRGVLRAKKVLSSAKRHSFLVGKNEPNHTCAEQFFNLLVKEEPPILSDIEEVFSVENVTKEFFNKYKNLFIQIKEELDRVIEKDSKLRGEFEEKGISTVDFSKKLLGQIVFLYFLQKKGWLGVEKGKEWGTGPRKFLRELYEGKYGDYDNFFNDMLEPLFYEALSTERGDDYYSRFKCRIPFLNGGLFEPMNDYDWVGTDILIDNSIFKDILDTFDTFNFTIKEDEPLEKEVAVDPEMLGKVFENLLEVKDRKSRGAFYTPREIVHYMCQQSLINYLETNTNIPREEIETFITKGDTILDSLIREEEYKREAKGEKLPESIKKNYREIDGLLHEIKIVDPAVGSGAFPVGMLNEIVKARNILGVFFNPEEREKRTSYNLKRETIENSLYGVDIDSSAVDIAKLRFWLSLIVDEEDMRNIKPLPNLDHKIMCGNSLLEEFEGIKLFDEKFLEDIDALDPIRERLKTIRKEIEKKKSERLSLSSGRGSKEKFDKITRELKQLEKEEKELKKQIGMGSNSQQIMDDYLEIRESQERLKRFKQKQEEFFNESSPKRKKELRREIEKLEWELIEATLKEQGNEAAMEKLERYKKAKSKPFFLWKLHFAEVFQRQNPGFDVVIGNPPYIQLQNKEKISLDAQKAYENAGYQTFTKRGDIYALFYERGYLVLRKNGTLTYITSNKWMRAEYGKKLRAYFLEHVFIEQLIDFGDSPIFEGATTYTNILIFFKAKSDNSPKVWDLSSIYRMNHSLAEMLLKHGRGEAEFTTDSFIILSEKEAGIKEKIERIATPLKEWDININYGIKTGYNEAFIIDGKTKDELIAKDPKSAEIIKPILRGRDIKRYKAEFADKWIIIVKYGAHKYLENKYPEIYKHLLQYKDKLSRRGQCTNRGGEGQHHWLELDNNPTDNYLNQFEKEKIVYAEIVFDSAFYYDKNGYYPEATVFIMTGESLKYLTAMLNSRLITYAFKRYYAGGDLRGNTFRYKKVFLEKLPIARILESEQKPFEEFVDTILEKKERGEDTTEEEREIDRLVYELYGLTDEEIKIVEKFGKAR